MDIFHNPKNEQVLDEIYVFVSEDADGKRGLLAGVLPVLGATILVTGSPRVLDVYRQIAQKIAAKAPDKKMRLYRYTRAECMEELTNEVGPDRQ